jgi:hypothetical protein
VPGHILVGLNVDCHFSPFRKLQGIPGKIEENLPKSSSIASPPSRKILVDIASQPKLLPLNRFKK